MRTFQRVAAAPKAPRSQPSVTVRNVAGGLFCHRHIAQEVWRAPPPHDVDRNTGPTASRAANRRTSSTDSTVQAGELDHEIERVVRGVTAPGSSERKATKKRISALTIGPDPTRPVHPTAETRSLEDILHNRRTFGSSGLLKLAPGDRQPS